MHGETAQPAQRALHIQQVEIQRRGGLCARFPVSCLLTDLLCLAGIACGPDYTRLTILDLTYGEGRFWKAFDGLFRPRIYAMDIRRLEWIVRPDFFAQAPAWEWRRHIPAIKPTLVAADPPWSPYHRGNDPRKHYDIYRMLGTPIGILRAAAAAARSHRAPLLVHYKEPWIPPNATPLVEAWFYGRSRLAAIKKPSWFAVFTFT